MKELTAQEAKALADGCRIVEKMVKKILRKVRSCAKRGEYSLRYPSSHGEVIDKLVCKKLVELGYRATTSIVAANIFVYWHKTGEE